MNNNNNFNENLKSKKYKNILKAIKEFLIKHKVLTLACISSFALSLFFSPKMESSTPVSTPPNESLSANDDNIKVSNNTSNTSGYIVKNKEMYQRGIDYYNKTKEEGKLCDNQAAVPFMLGKAIKETSAENNLSESDVADYFYGIITTIKDETKSNLDNLVSERANSEVVEYEKKILAFINDILKNYNINYTLTKEDEDEYFTWIDNKNALLNPNSKDSNTKEDAPSDSDTNYESDSTIKNVYLNIKHGTFEEAIANGDTLVVKAKIKPSYSNKATINQNAFNVEDIVKNQDGYKYSEIQYWAVADMQNGSESKVISFTIDKNVIAMIENGSIPGNMILNYVSDLWILPSLKN